ncbi:OTU domain-containing protein 7B-like [Oppia nitens]|uniref:OTU domain-containing protein 7B-like n=1 Tax=Oppia nitens TaxID=1686743 RepID=UPI0023D9F3F1|nr:OTU domain-containing protein 7B-like [Oppia nitens]
MDRILSEFITRTSAEAGFARDLLASHNWDLKTAINAYYVMKGLVQSNDSEDSNRCDNDVNDLYESHPLSSIDVKLNNELNIKKCRIDSLPQFVTIKCSSEPSLSSHSSQSSDNSSNTSSPSKLAIQSKCDDSTDDVLEETNKKLSRGISRATDNVNLVSKARNEFAQDFKTSCRGSRLLNTNSYLETPDFTFTLPDLSIHPEDFRIFLEHDLIEKSTLISLESAQRLNWWSDVCQKLWPLATTGDGNCLLHAASLGMWGFHDRLLILRKALHALMSNSSYTAAFYRRWKWQTYFQNFKVGLTFSESEWRQEWDCLLKMSSTEPRVRAQTDNKNELNGGKKTESIDEIQSHVYESLEEIHIFALAHVLRRPIIVIADTMLKDLTGEAFFPIPFGGIYLPLECPDDNLMKSPLCLTYDSAHFSALVSMNKDIQYVDNHPPSPPPAAIPLVDYEHNILPLQFVIDPGEEMFKNDCQHFSNELVKKLTLSENEKLKLLKLYFDVDYIKLPKHQTTELTTEKKLTKRNAKLSAMEKSRTLPSSFESDDSSSDAPSASSVGGSVSSKAKALSSKAAKQLLTITKHFGSLGRMSKRIKKNLGTFAKRSTSFRHKHKNSNDLEKITKTSDSNAIKINSCVQQIDTLSNSESNDDYLIDKDMIIVALLHTNRRHIYYDEMIRNYLSTARARFLRDKRQHCSSSSSSSSVTTVTKTSAITDQNCVSMCVNTGCKMFGTSANNYLCSACFEQQKQHLKESQTNYITSNLDIKTNGNKSDNINKVLDFQSDSHSVSQDLKVSLNCEKSKLVDEELDICCANSHFYVPTNI